MLKIKTIQSFSSTLYDIVDEDDNVVFQPESFEVAEAMLKSWNEYVQRQSKSDHGLEVNPKAFFSTMVNRYRLNGFDAKKYISSEEQDNPYKLLQEEFESRQKQAIKEKTPFYYKTIDNSTEAEKKQFKESMLEIFDAFKDCDFIENEKSKPKVVGNNPYSGIGLESEDFGTVGMACRDSGVEILHNGEVVAFIDKDGIVLKYRNEI